MILYKVETLNINSETINDFADSELIVLLSSYPHYLDKKYDLETLTHEELLELAKTYLIHD